MKKKCLFVVEVLSNLARVHDFRESHFCISTLKMKMTSQFNAAEWKEIMRLAEFPQHLHVGPGSSDAAAQGLDMKV